MRRCRACSRTKPTQRKSWLLKSIFNHLVLAVLAGGILYFFTQRGSETAANPDQQSDAARLQQEIAVLLERMQEREERLAKLERARDEERRTALDRKRDDERLERERQREEKIRSEREAKERAAREERDKEALRREVDELHATVKSQKAKIAQLESQVQRVAANAGKTNHLVAHDPAPQPKSTVSDPLRIIAGARAKQVAEDETQGTRMLERANEILAADRGSVRQARLVWLQVIERLPETMAARQARKFLADTRPLLDAENEKDAAEALKSANSAFYSGAAALGRLRYRNIMADYPTTNAAREAQKMYSLLR